MTRMRVLGLTVMPAAAVVLYAQGPAPAAVFRFQQLVPGVYTGIGTGALNVGGNATIIVNQNDALIVDSHVTPEVARVLLREVKTITDKPIRFIVNSHFHFDHVTGNQVMPPTVDIIGHEFTRMKLLTDLVHEKGVLKDTLAGFPGQIGALQTRVAGEQDPAAKARLAQQLRVQQTYAEQIKELKPTPPTVTVKDHMTIFRGDREIRILFLGRAHTGGDVVVYLPKERVVATGDIVVNGGRGAPPYFGDGYANEWPDTLERLKQLDFDMVSPGHGEPFKGKDQIIYLQAYIRDLWQQASKLHEAKVPVAEAAKRIDLSAHKAHYANIAGPGAAEVAVSRIYDVIEGRAEK